jgi:hypothetical protein
MKKMVRPFAAVCLAVAVLSACGGTDDDAAPNPTEPGGLPTAVSTAGAGQTATLEGQPLVSVRTLPPAALSAEQLEAAGNAETAQGSIAMATTAAPGVEPWEYVSIADDGWLIWQPQVVLDVLEDAGPNASLVLVEPVDWPDACLGAARPDEACATVITQGYRVIVQRDASLIEYHTARVSGFRVATGGAP